MKGINVFGDLDLDFFVENTSVSRSVRSDVNEPDFFELEPSRAFSTQAEPSSSLARISSFELNFAKKGRKLAV